MRRLSVNTFFISEVQEGDGPTEYGLHQDQKDSADSSPSFHNLRKNTGSLVFTEKISLKNVYSCILPF